MAIRKTHVKSAKRQAREKEQAAARAAASASGKFKDKKRKPDVQTGFRFKGQTQRYKDIAINLQSLLDEAVERYGRYDVATKNIMPDADDADDSDMDESEDMLATPMSAALAELILLNTSLPFQHLHKTLYSPTRSLPLIVYHRLLIARTIFDNLSNTNRNELALSAVHTMDLLPPYLQSLSPDPDFALLDLDRILTPLMRALVNIAMDPPSVSQNNAGDRGNDPTSPTEISKRAFEVLAWIFRYIGSDLFNRGDSVSRAQTAWSWISDGLQGQRGEAHFPDAEVKILKDESEVTDLLSIVPDLDLEVRESETAAPDLEINGDELLNTSEEAAEDLVDTAEDETDSSQDAAPVKAVGKRPSHAASSIHRRHLLATCFGFAIRKAKVGSRLDAISEVVVVAVAAAEQSASLEDALAWMISESAKSIEVNIHSRGPAIFDAFLRQTMQIAKAATNKGMLHALTVLLHHSRAEHLESIVDMVMHNLETVIAAPDHTEQLRFSIQLCELLPGVRKGSRLSETSRMRLLSLVADLVSHDRLASYLGQDELLADICRLGLKALLLISDLQTMLQAGRRVLNGICSLPVQYANLSAACIGILASQHWSLFSDFCVPHIAKLPAEKKVPLLSQLYSSGQLAKIKVDAMSAAAEVSAILREWLTCRRNGKLTQRQTAAMLSCLTICPHFEMDDQVFDDVQAILTELLDRGSTAEAQREFAETAVNSAVIVAAALCALGVRGAASLVADGTYNKILTQFGWHRLVLDALAKHLNDRQDQLLVSGNTLEIILRALDSHDALARSAALHLLCHVESASSIAKQLLQVEILPLTVQGSRTKALEVKRLGRFITRMSKESQDFAIAIHYLLALLRVNFRPLWSPAIEALGSGIHIGRREVWLAILHQLELTASQDLRLHLVAPPMWSHKVKAGEDAVEGFQKQFSCTSNDRISGTFTHLRLHLQAGEHHLATENQISPETLITISYEANLLQLIATHVDVAEQHSRELLSVFFRQFGRIHARESLSLGRAGRERLTSWLSLFSKFTNPKALHRSEEFYAYLRDLLSYPDIKLQKLALSCILTWKSSSLLKYQEHLHDLLDDHKFRDALLQLSLSGSEGSEDLVQPEDRPVLSDILLRILYGVVVSRSGAAASAAVKSGRRRAILSAMKACTRVELDIFLDLMLNSLDHERDSVPSETTQIRDVATHAQNAGFLTLLGDVLQYLGNVTQYRWKDLMGAVLKLAASSRDSPGESSSTEHQRKIRQLAIRRITSFFSVDPSFDFKAFLPAIFRELVSPRLEKFAEENAQAPSALLQLLLCWASHEQLIDNLVNYNGTVLPAVYTLMANKSIKPTVTSTVLQFVECLLTVAKDNEDLKRRIIDPHILSLLDNLAILMASRIPSMTNRDGLALRQIDVLSLLSTYVRDVAVAAKFIAILLPLLTKPHAIISERNKATLLRVLAAITGNNTASLHASQMTLFTQIVSTIPILLGTVNIREGRSLIIQIMQDLAASDATIKCGTEIVAGLNAYSIKRIDVPDFDTRLSTFARLNGTEYLNMSSKDWTPLLYQLFYNLRDVDELSMRSNASAALRNFVSVAGPSLDSGIRTLFAGLFRQLLRANLASKSEVIRAETILVLSAAVESANGIAELEEMRCLLAGGDQEANFFHNIYHVQVHRRTRAMRRLADEADEQRISSKTLFELFIPLLSQNLVLEQNQSQSTEVVNETVQCIGRLSGQLAWSAYNRCIQHFLKMTQKPTEGQRIYVRLIVAMLKHFKFRLDEEADAPLLATVLTRLLPALMRFVDAREGTDESLRIIMAEGIAYVLQHLPEQRKVADLSNLVTSLAQILRSRAQEVRDLTRSTLANIVARMGAEYMSLCIREIRAVLQRGPQLHVLASVLHTLLARVDKEDHSMRLDDSLQDGISIAYNDLFGNPSKDRESAEFRAKTKFREVRSSKSLDSLEILARHASFNQISLLIAPLRDILDQSESIKTMNVVTDVTRHITTGILLNTTCRNEDLLILCQALIRQNSDFLKPRKALQAEKKAAKDYQVQLRRVAAAPSGHYQQNSFYFVAMGLDLVNGAFKKGKFDIKDADTVSMLDPLIATVGDTLYTDNTHVLERSLRTVAALVRCPLRSLDKMAPILMKQMIEILDDAGGAGTDLAQSCLRSLAALIRDRKSLQPTEQQTAKMISFISQNLDEIDQLPALFALLRAIVGRVIIAPEVYDILDHIAQIAVTHQSHETRELSRSIYLQFLLDYPQGKKRLTTAMEYLARNLGGYAHEAGRISVLELVNAILSKFTIDILEQHAKLFFAALTMCIVNDTSTKCREMATENIKVIFRRVGKQKRQELLDIVLSWSDQNQQALLRTASARVTGTIIDAAMGSSELGGIATTLVPSLSSIISEYARATTQFDGEDEDCGQPTLGDDWQMAYHAIHSLSRSIKASPAVITSIDADLWRCVRELLLHPHGWMRLASAQLIGIQFSSGNRVPLSDLIEAAANLSVQLRSKLLTPELSIQIVKNLFFIGKEFASQTQSKTLPDKSSHPTEIDGDDDKPERDPTSDPFHWLFVKLSHSARVAHQNRSGKYEDVPKNFKWSSEPTAVLQIFGALISEPTVSVDQLKRQVQQVMIPVVRILSDGNQARDPQLDDLQVLARELQDMLTQKIGASEVTKAYNDIQRKIGVRREERKRSAAMASIADPERDARRKAQRTESKTASKARKNKSFADTKLRYGMMDKRRS